MVQNWILCLSLFCASPEPGTVMPEAQARALLDASRECLLKKGKGWDDQTWSNIYEWNTCLEERLFRQLSPEQTMEIKRYLADSGYYRYDTRKGTFSNARKKIQPRDIEGILSVVATVLHSRGPQALPAVPAPPPSPAPRPVMSGIPAPAPVDPKPTAPAPAPVAVEARPLPAAPPAAPVGVRPVPPPAPVAPVEARPVAQAATLPPPPPAQVASPVPTMLPATLPHDRVVIAQGLVLLPQGVVLLVRKDQRYGALRITGTRPGEKGGASSSTYESCFQGDGSGSFRAETVERRGGRVLMKPREERGAWSLKRGTSTLRMGTWSFEYVEPGGVRMYPFAAAPGDYGYEFAPVAAAELQSVDVRDPRILWYRCELNRQLEIPLKDLPR